MRTQFTSLGVLTVLALSTAAAAAPRPKPVPKDGASSIVITFKDGHRQSFNLSDIARIEFTAPAHADSDESSFMSDRGRFVGKWNVGDGNGNTFTITLSRDGEAKKSMGSGHGTWTVESGEAVIKWDDGWHDIIRRSGRKYLKAAYSPGTSLSENPSNTAEAIPTTPN
jgi:hypothetical protein